ncbi:glycosyltransferase family 39 protein [Limisalsivibrio acetivorans]|uniref:glycosyltransferase family 39 protein n=1 Tax=Limisalsivibrio acetivorans TaxID=1304888 RepID=UPI0003B65F8D|nr:glycosyltransferase family 39 protein [Limisalsivibrio acetivorans]
MGLFSSESRLKAAEFREFVYEARWALWFAFVVYAANIASADLRGDSIMYAMISKNILTLDSPLIMHYNGSVYMNKPPLLFWLNALPMKLFGYSVFSAKLIPLITAVLLSGFVYHITRKLYEDANIAHLAVFIMNSTYVVYKNTYSLRLESMVTLFMVVALWSFMHYQEDRAKGWLYTAGIACGLGFMVKGFVGVLPMAAVFIYALIFDRKIFSKEEMKKILPALLLFLLTFIWWYTYVSLKTDFFTHFFKNQILDRMMNGLFQNGDTGINYAQRPIYNYILYLLEHHIIYLPFLIYGMYRTVKMRTADKSRQAIFLLTALIVTFVAIHFISTRQSRYMYQFYVIAAVFTAGGLGAVLRINYRKFLVFFSVLYASVLIISPVDMNWRTYSELEELAQMSSMAGIPIVAEVDKFKDHEDKSGVAYFLDEYSTVKPETGRYFLIMDKKSGRSADMLQLMETRRLRIGIAGE